MIPWGRVVGAREILTLCNWKHPQSIAHAIDRRGFPPACKQLAGRVRLWDLGDVEAWLDRQS